MHAPASSTTAGAVPTRPTQDAPSGRVACLRTPSSKSAYGRFRRSATRRESSSIAVSQLRVDPKPDPRRARQKLDRAVVVRRPETAGDAQQVVGEALVQRRLEVGRIVPHDRDAHRVDAEAQERRSEIRAVPVVAVAADELGARRDDGYAGCQPVGVTMITRGFRPGT